MARGNHSSQWSHQLRRILVIRMQHDHNVRTSLKSFTVASFLIPAVTQVRSVLERGDVEFARQSHCLVRTAVVNKEHFVNNIKGEFFICLAQCPGGIVRRHDYDNFLFVKHGGYLLSALLDCGGKVKVQSLCGRRTSNVLHK